MPSPKYKIYVLCYNDETKQQADVIVAAHEPSDVQLQLQVVQLGPSKFFENQFFEWLKEHESEWNDATYVGMIAYSIFKKIKYAENIDKLIEFLEKETILSNPDVMSLYNLTYVHLRSKQYTSMLEASAFHHGPFIMSCITKMLQLNGYTERAIYDTNIPAFACNYWLAKPMWMSRYIKFVSRCMTLLEINNDLQNYIHQKAYYNGKLDAQTLQQLTGRPYYTLHAFVFERLPCFFFFLEGAKIARVGGSYNFFA